MGFLFVCFLFCFVCYCCCCWVFCLFVCLFVCFVFFWSLEGLGWNPIPPLSRRALPPPHLGNWYEGEAGRRGVTNLYNLYTHVTMHCLCCIRVDPLKKRGRTGERKRSTSRPQEAGTVCAKPDQHWCRFHSRKMGRSACGPFQGLRCYLELRVKLKGSCRC